LDGSGKEDEVRRPLGSWARPVAALLALTLVLAGSAPVVAAEPEAKGAAPASRPTLLAAANATVAAKPLPANVAAQATPAPATTEKGFFGTTAGKVALVVMAAGTGFMVYSAFKDNDPVKSVFR
jgi:hypothetical protein